ncbi:Telomerase reverse transcriptase [Coemansia thaxteri]|uniref:Telomerase reverse transcriptase n=1 Tax=Coemansia thaxteri TaxID=2663907 RepID=A0A9W8EK14_9FUNG|nr:Telomerase reverse transcriptase [Coemansia thaxteri]
MVSCAALDPFFQAVTPLGEYMDTLVDSGRCGRDGDSTDYVQFLRTTMVGHSPIRNRLAFYEPVEKLADTVQTVIGLLLRRGMAGSGSTTAWRERNILAMGYEVRREGTMSCSSGGWGVVNNHVNSSVVELSKGRWLLLLDRVGTEAMVHLFLSTSVFLPLRNSCFTQIVGTPLVCLQLPQPVPIVPPAVGALAVSETIRTQKRKLVAENAGAVDNAIGDHVAVEEDEQRSQSLDRSSDQRRALKRQRLAYEAGAALSCDARLSENPGAVCVDTPLDLSSVVIDKGAMLYSHPLLVQHKVKWRFPKSFPLGGSVTPSELIKAIFAKTPLFATSPPSHLLCLAARMLKLHKRFNYRHHLFKRCLAPWQTNPIGSNHSKSSSLADSDAGNMMVIDELPSKAETRADVQLTTVSGGSRAIQHVKLDGTHSAWLGGKHGGAARDIYAALLFWILNDYAMHLIRTFFYVTECSRDRTRLYFFRSDVWTNVTRKAWRSLEAEMYTKKALAEVTAGPGGARMTFGYSHVRLLPKEHGFRAISNLKRSFVLRSRASQRDGGGGGSSNSKRPLHGFTEVPVASTNKVLADSLAALSYVRKIQPHLVGSAISSADDIYTKLKGFKNSTHVKPLLGQSRFFMVKLDIKKAYDTIVQPKLLELLETQLPCDEYVVYKYWLLTLSFGKFRPSYLRQGGLSSKPVSFGDMTRSMSKNSRNVVFGDQSATSYLHMKTICGLIQEHITNNMVSMRSGIWQQKTGIPQGSVLSAMLCNFFYGQLEREHLASLIDPARTLVIRMIDDFLIISTDQSLAMALLERMYQGVPEYGCELNKAKTLTNFEATVGGQRIDLATGATFPWCGMLFDERTLDVSVDYSRLAQAGVLGVALGGRAVQVADFVLGHKLSIALRLRMHKLYMDCSFNSRLTVLRNLYQNFLLCGMKMHSICQQLPPAGRHDGVLAKVVWDMVSLGTTLLRTRCGNSSIPLADVTWLGLHAFHVTLRRKQARYSQLLARLHSAMSLPKYSQMTRRLGTVINSAANETVLSIAY